MASSASCSRASTPTRSHWRFAPSLEGVALGSWSGAEARTLSTVPQDIVPALERHGIAAIRAWSRIVAPAAA